MPSLSLPQAAAAMIEADTKMPSPRPDRRRCLFKMGVAFGVGFDRSAMVIFSSKPMAFVRALFRGANNFLYSAKRVPSPKGFGLRVRLADNAED